MTTEQPTTASPLTISVHRTVAERAAAGFDALTTARTPDPDPFVPELPSATAPHGSRAARQVAETLAEQGAHSHLVAYGETVRLSGQCHAGLDALRGLL